MNNLRRQIQNDKNDEEELMSLAAKLFNYENEANFQ